MAVMNMGNGNDVWSLFDARCKAKGEVAGAKDEGAEPDMFGGPQAAE